MIKMKNFDLNRFNLAKAKLNENILVLKRTDYKEPIVKDGYLVDENGEKIGTKGDMYNKVIMDKILEHGTLDHYPRPRYKDFYENARYDKLSHKIITPMDGELYLNESDKVVEKEEGVEVWVPAHTISLNNEFKCSYDLSKGESPMITLRPIAMKASFAEILWIYQQASNDLVTFDELQGISTWDKDQIIHNWWLEWAIRDESGNLILNEKGHPNGGSCYGGTIATHGENGNMFRSEVIDRIKEDPDGRRNICSMWQIDDFKEPHALKPCAFLTDWKVRREWDGIDYLDMVLIQRSSDFATAGCINQVQYAALLKMVAQELKLEPGIFTWIPTNVQLYDRHIDQAIEMLNREPINCKAEITLNKDIDNFDDFKLDDIKITDYPRELIKKKNPQLTFPLGI